MQRFQPRVIPMLALAISMALAGNAHAGPTQMKKVQRVTQASAFLIGKNPTLAPFAHVRFCARNPADCALSTNSKISTGDTKQGLAILSRINARVNSQIAARNDDATDGDLWDVDVTSGDCEDFALTKRRALINAGWPPAAVRIAIAITSVGEGHAVLIATTSGGDVVLDNRTNQIKPWNKSSLRFTKIQSTENPKAWLGI